MLRDAPGDARDVLRWRIARGGAASVSDFREPVTGEPVLGVCVYDASVAPQPLLAGTVLPGGTCGTRPCWKRLGTSGYRYRNRSGGVDGITDVKLRANVAGELQLVVKGRGPHLLVPRLPLATPVVVQVVVSDAGGTTCWQASFGGAARNDATIFKATGS